MFSAGPGDGSRSDVPFRDECANTSLLPPKSRQGKSVWWCRVAFALACGAIPVKIRRSVMEVEMLAGVFIALTLCAPPGQPELVAGAHKDAVARFGAAVWNLRRERLLTAAQQLESAAKTDPGAAAPKRELIRVYSQLGREPDAIRIAKELLERDPTDVETAHALARLYLDMGELKDALAAGRLAAGTELPLERADKSVAVYRDLATICEKMKLPAAAAEALEKAVEIVVDQRAEVIKARAFTPRDADLTAAECLEKLGKLRTSERKFAEAAAAFESAAKLFADPKVDDPAAAARLAWNLSGVYQAKGEPAAALKHLDRFLPLQPIAPEPYERLAALLRSAGRGDEVIPLLQRLSDTDRKNLPLRAVMGAEMARDPATLREADGLFHDLLNATNDPKVVAVIIRSHLEQGRPREIVGELDRAFNAIADDKKRDEPLTAAWVKARDFATERLHVVGDILRADGKGSNVVLRAAATDLQGGSKRNYRVYYYLGQLAARHDELALAALQFQEAARRAPRGSFGVEGTQADAYAALIDVLRRAGKPEQVARACRDGLENAPDVAPVFFQFHLAGALAELGDADGALSAIDKAIAQSGESDRLTVRLQKVAVLRLLGKSDEAIVFARKLFDEFDSPADRQRTRYALASAFWAAKKRAEAEAELRAILDRDPDHAAAANDLGFHLANEGRDLGEAERLVRRAIANDRLDRRKAGNAEPEKAAYIDSLGWVLFRQGKLTEARAELERAAALHAGAADPVVWDHLGDVLFRSGEKVKARAAWEKARALYENEPRGVTRARLDGRLAELKRKLKLAP